MLGFDLIVFWNLMNEMCWDENILVSAMQLKGSSGNESYAVVGGRGDRRYGVFDIELPAALRKLLFDRHFSLQNVKIIVSEVDGYQLHLISIVHCYKCLIESRLNYFKKPTDVSVDEGVIGNLSDVCLKLYFLEAYRPGRKGHLFLVKGGMRSVKFKIMEPNPLEYCVVTPDCEIFCEGEPSKKKDENRMDEVCYDGVRGLRKQMARVRELVELPLRHPQFFKSIDDKPPIRILLYGPLESENTLITIVVANEMGVSFFVIYGHEIISNLAGEGESNLRGTFEEAEKNAPSIILIDEIYSIAPKRWKISGGILKSMTSEGETSLAKAIANEDSIATHRGSSSRDASGIADMKLNQLLIELDGLFENEGVHTMRRVMKMMLRFHSNIRITQSDLLVNILGEALRGWEFDHLLRWIILGNEHMVHNLLAGRDPILVPMHQRPPSKPPFQFLHPSLGDKTHSRGEYCHVHGYDGIGNKERRREINGSVRVLIMLGLDLIVFLCY